jgi:hypothetical protein
MGTSIAAKKAIPRRRAAALPRRADNLAFSSSKPPRENAMLKRRTGFACSIWRSPPFAPGDAAHAADGYAGKTIELIGRRAARRRLRHLCPRGGTPSRPTHSGEPTVVVKNMPGAGSAKAAQYIATIAPKDGTSIAASCRARSWAAARRPHRAAVRPDQGALRRHRQQRHARLRDAEERQDPEIRGRAEGEGEVRRQRAERLDFEYGYLHKHTSGALWDIVPGYRGTPEMALAMERGEIDGDLRLGLVELSLAEAGLAARQQGQCADAGQLEPHPLLTKMGVPTVFEFVKDEDDRKVVELIISQTVFHRSYIAPPDTPPAQLEVLRASFDKTVADRRSSPTPRSSASTSSRCPASRCRRWWQALRDAAGHRRARPQGDPAGLRGLPLYLSFDLVRMD